MIGRLKKGLPPGAQHEALAAAVQTIVIRFNRCDHEKGRLGEFSNAQ